MLGIFLTVISWGRWLIVVDSNCNLQTERAFYINELPGNELNADL